MQLVLPASLGDGRQWVSILTRPGGRVQHERWAIIPMPHRVSILTRPGGRVQPGQVVNSPVAGVQVSILTRPGGRVQPGSLVYNGYLTEFQSSPVPEDGCNAVQPH